MNQQVSSVMSRLHISAIVVLGLAVGAQSASALAQVQDASQPSVSGLGQTALPPAPPPAQPAPGIQTGVAPLPANMRNPIEESQLAIAECRERRLRKELNSYAESARCSNPRIFAAWQRANYPHMDLITQWLDFRESASEKVDQRLLTPTQFEQQMDDLALRLTAEERRRRVGLLTAPDSDLALQLPPSTNVTAVVTPPGEEKQAAKKTAAARARATASAQHVDPNAGTTVQAMTELTSLNGKNSGVGGPFIPVDPNSPAARAAQRCYV